MKDFKISLIAVLAVVAVACSGRMTEEERKESTLAADMGRRQALEVAAEADDTLRMELLIIDVRAREAELRRRGAERVADSYIDAFMHTLDSVNPSLAAELQR